MRVKKEIKINFSVPLKNYLGEKGFDLNLGARPLKRLIQKIILDPLSLKIIVGEIGEGGNVSVDLENEKVVFRTLGAPVKKSVLTNSI